MTGSSAQLRMSRALDRNRDDEGARLGYWSRRAGRISEDIRMKSLVHRVSVGLALVWVLAVVGGFLAIHAYEGTPGAPGRAAPQWPDGSPLALAGDRPTLVMVAHPRCPCTRASAAELARIVARCEGRLEVYVLIFTPQRADPTWSRSGCAQSFAAIPGVHLLDDLDGVEACRFGAQTSGQVALYAPDGRLLYRGGITRARGQEGDNRGRENVISLVRDRSCHSPESPVFGCPIF
jgi:hypothetical protein